MSKQVKPHKDSENSKKQQVQEMFDTISGNYDGLNRVISLGIDKSWRKKVIDDICAQRPDSVLDIATGTGDLALSLAAKGVKNVVGLDLSQGMLNIAEDKIKEAGYAEATVKMMQGDSEKLPFQDNSFEAVCVSFGVRNFEDLDKGLTEIHRVLKPGGLFVVLETSVPTKFPLRQGYQLYSNYILPGIGKLFSKDKNAYDYLSKSAAAFPYGEKFCNILAKNGFTNTEYRPQTFGVATIYTASK